MIKIYTPKRIKDFWKNNRDQKTIQVNEISTISDKLWEDVKSYLVSQSSEFGFIDYYNHKGPAQSFLDKFLKRNQVKSLTMTGTVYLPINKINIDKFLLNEKLIKILNKVKFSE